MTELQSPVILVCIQNPEFINITVSHVYNHFTGVGEIEKILVFERNKPVWKVLVQFTTEQAATQAQELSNSIMNGLSILVFLSNRKQLDFQARNQYARYYNAQSPGMIKSVILQTRMEQPQKQVQSQMLPQVQRQKMPDHNLDQINFNKPDCDSDYDEENEDILQKEVIEEQPQEELNTQFGTVVNQNINNLLAFSNFQMKNTFASQQLGQHQYPKIENKIVQSEILQQKKLLTKVVYANWFDYKQTTMTMIYNLFSTFGNITKMIFFKQKCNVLIEYTTEISVKFLLTYFNETNPTLFAQKLKVYPSNYEFIFFRNCEEGKLPTNTDEEEFYIGAEHTFRYKSNNFKYLVPPSNQIMLTNLKKEFCEEGIIIEHFSKFGQIEKIKICCEEKNKNKCLLKFTEIDSAIQALAFMHNFDYNKRKIQIFFSKTKW